MSHSIAVLTKTVRDEFNSLKYIVRNIAVWQ